MQEQSLQVWFYSQLLRQSFFRYTAKGEKTNVMAVPAAAESKIIYVIGFNSRPPNKNILNNSIIDEIVRVTNEEPEPPISRRVLIVC